MYYLLFILCVSSLVSCQVPIKPTPPASQTTTMSSKTKDLVILKPYGTAYNAQRRQRQLFPIPATLVEQKTMGKFAENTYLKWETTLSYRTTTPHWVSKTLYLNEEKEVLEEDVFKGQHRYTIFDMAKEDSYADNCPTLDCANPPTVLTNERLKSIYNHTRGTWVIQHTTVNPDVAANYNAEREETKAIRVREMQELLKKWEIK